MKNCWGIVAVGEVSWEAHGLAVIKLEFEVLPSCECLSEEIANCRGFCGVGF